MAEQKIIARQANDKTKIEYSEVAVSVSMSVIPPLDSEHVSLADG